MKTRNLFFRILTVVAGVGILVMVILGSTGMKEGMGENHVNAFLLSLLSVPLLSLFIVKSEPRPLSEQADHSGRVAGKGNGMELKAAEEKQELGTRLLSLINNVPGMVSLRHPDWSLSFIGAEVEQVTGYSAEEFTSGVASWIRIIHPDDREWLKEAFREAVKNQVKTLRVEYRIRHKNGKTINCEWFITKLRDARGDFSSVCAMAHDVTEKTQLEKSLQTAQRMEAVGTLAGGIANDFNNALTGIIGFGELLRNRMAGDVEGLHDLNEILRCAERAFTLTRQLLTYARKQIIEPVNLSLNKVITDLCKLASKMVGEHIEIRTFLAKGLPTIWADVGQIEQAQINLPDTWIQLLCY